VKRENEVGQKYAVAAVKGDPSLVTNEATEEDSTGFVNRMFGILK
jgi:hypothetical protein